MRFRITFGVRWPPPHTAAPVADPPTFTATLARAYDGFDGHQGVAVDKKYFYVVDNQCITKHDQATGKPLLQRLPRPCGAGVPSVGSHPPV